MDPVKTAQEVASLNRLNTVEAALEGLAGAQNNFKAKWVRFNESGEGVVLVNGKEYTGTVVGSYYAKAGMECYLRVGKDIKIIGW